MRFTIDLHRAEDGRVEGTLQRAGEPPQRVSGWLDVLRALEAGLPDRDIEIGQVRGKEVVGERERPPGQVGAVPRQEGVPE